MADSQGASDLPILVLKKEFVLKQPKPPMPIEEGSWLI
eukprot:COSAG05_NODE_12807_length_454_cov_0.464789_1_plen_37_part_10